jgi:SAM-dependent methyltransferase
MPTPNAREDRDLWSEKARCWDLHIGDDGDRNRRRHVDPAIWRMLGDVAGLDVLDAGCGTGYLSAKLAQRGARVRAVDFAPGMLEQARSRFQRLGLALEPVEDDCCTLHSVPDASQDRVVSNYVLQDLEDLPAAARAFSRVLRPGGHAVVVFGHPCFAVPGGPERDERAVTYTWPFPYFEERRCEEVWRGTHHASGERFDFPSRFTFYHRPLKSYWQAFRAAGFAVLDFDEPVLQPPYPPDLPPDELRRTLQCAWSVAFQLRRGELRGAGGAERRA